MYPHYGLSGALGISVTPEMVAQAAQLAAQVGNWLKINGEAGEADRLEERRQELRNMYHFRDITLPGNNLFTKANINTYNLQNVNDAERKLLEQIDWYNRLQANERNAGTRRRLARAVVVYGEILQDVQARKAQLMAQNPQQPQQQSPQQQGSGNINDGTNQPTQAGFGSNANKWLIGGLLASALAFTAYTAFKKPKQGAIQGPLKPKKTYTKKKKPVRVSI